MYQIKFRYFTCGWQWHSMTLLISNLLCFSADQVYGDQAMHDVVRSHCIDYMVSAIHHGWIISLLLASWMHTWGLGGSDRYSKSCGNPWLKSILKQTYKTLFSPCCRFCCIAKALNISLLHCMEAYITTVTVTYWCYCIWAVFNHVNTVDYRQRTLTIFPTM